MELSELSNRYKEIEDDLRPIIEQLHIQNKKSIQTKKYLVTLKRMISCTKRSTMVLRQSTEGCCPYICVHISSFNEVGAAKKYCSIIRILLVAERMLQMCFF